MANTMEKSAAHLQLFDRLAALADDEADLAARDQHLHHRLAAALAVPRGVCPPVGDDVVDQLLRFPAARHT